MTKIKKLGHNKKMIRVINAYIIWSYFIRFSLICIFLVFFLMSFQTIRVIELLLLQEVNWEVLFKILGSFFLSSLPIAYPIAGFIASMTLFGHLSQNSEYVALRSLGYSIYRLMVPLLIIGSICSFLYFVLNDEFIPAGKAYGRKKLAELNSKAILVELKPGRFFTSIPGLTLFSHELISSSYKMNDIFIHQDGDDQYQEKTIWAQEGQLYLESPNSISDENSQNHLKLQHGVIYLRSKNKNQLEKIHFNKMDYILPPFESYFDNSRKPGLLSLNKLFSLRTRSQFLLSKGKIDQERFIDIYIEIIERYTVPVICLIFIFLGALLGQGHFRKSSKGRSLQAFAIMLSYYVPYYLLLGLAKKSTIHPYFPGLAMLAIFMVLTLWLAQKSRWVGGPSS